MFAVSRPSVLSLRAAADCTRSLQQCNAAFFFFFVSLLDVVARDDPHSKRIAVC